jgi:hypothetical protein
VKWFKLDHQLKNDIFDLVILNLWEVLLIAVRGHSIDNIPDTLDDIGVVVVDKCSKQLQLGKQQLNFLLFLRALRIDTLFEFNFDTEAVFDGIG